MAEDLIIKASDFMQMLKEQGLVIGPKTVFDAQMVKGIPLNHYRNRILRKKLLSASEISDAQLWGAIGQKMVYTIIKNEVPEDDQIKVGYKNTIKIPIATVKSIAASRGIELTD
ncbi:MAG: hypothetical protein CMC13_00380 [Flavobacteriaceae bacterium]|nr:hypothetical protein [Flavobacteriaceae bacterium]|tara:strand:- start:29778 stop:30119 length:342 start_codon:yes stop_codon:yes gene_type:complete